MKPINLFGSGIAAYSAVVSRQRRLNCFYDARPDGDKNKLILRGTPGAASFVLLPTSPVRGWRVIGSLMYVVAGSALYSVTTTGTVTYINALSTTTGLVSISDNGVQMIIVDGTYGYVYTLVTGSYYQSALNAAGSFGRITADANFPNGCSSVAFLDGRLVVNRPSSRQFYCSEQYDATAWTNASSLPTFGTKENSSDPLAAVDVFNGVIVLWGTQSIEFWQDVGSSPLPFSRVTGSSQTWGLAAVNSRQLLNNTMIFLGQNPQGGIQVMMLNGYTPQRVSNSDIENLISSFSTWSDATSLTYIVDGHPMYQINFPTANRSFLYDSLTQMWFDVQTGVAPLARHFGNLGIAFNAVNYIADSTTGNIYQLRTDVYTDNGTAIKRQVASVHIVNGGNVLGVSELFLDMETGVGLQSGQGADPKIMMQVSKDGGRTFGKERWASLGLVGQYRTPRVVWRRLGTARDFVFQFTMTDAVKFTIVGGSAVILGQAGEP